MSEPKLNLILARDADGKLKLWACRGEGKGCNRNRYRKSLKPCDDCMPTRDEETMADLVERLARGDG
jgi:hypothetical protein